MRYDIITDFDKTVLVNLVNRKMSQGWELAGPLFVRGNLFVQPMLKRPDEPV
jgi:hypothetical protein